MSGVCGKNAEVGDDGNCYRKCPDGWEPLNNGAVCAKKCPSGYGASGSTPGSTDACIRPAFEREIKPMLDCKPGATRQYDKCLLACPVGAKAHFNLCVPSCPRGFVESSDGLSCQAEFMKRTATPREACYSDETRIGGRLCLKPCEEGMVPLETNPELCYATVPTGLQQYFWTGDPDFQQTPGPLVAKVIFARSIETAQCTIGYEALNGVCFSKCPQGSSELGTQCLAECPSDFKFTNNQTACLRPSKKRERIEGFFASFTRVLAIIAGVFAAFYFSFLLK